MYKSKRGSKIKARVAKTGRSASDRRSFLSKSVRRSGGNTPTISTILSRSKSRIKRGW